MDAEAVQVRSDRQLAEFKLPTTTSVPFDLAEVQALKAGFHRRTEADGYMHATREQIALDASVFLKLALAEKRLIDRMVELEGWDGNA
jgi:hypothetical protein